VCARVNRRLSKEAFDVDRGLWLETSSHELYPASTSYSREGFSLQWYAFLGRILGKALYEGILVDVPFAPFFLSKWLGRASGFDDLASFEPDLYHGLVQLKNYPGDVEKDLSLNFTVTDDGAWREVDPLACAVSRLADIRCMPPWSQTLV
jgi:ubiquitin-protein ligase E3 C